MKQYGLIGMPLTHSFSKKYFSEKFLNENINAQYDLYELNDIEEFVSLAHQGEFSGLNVTIPYKEKVLKFLDELDDSAAKIGAVNVIQFIHSQNKIYLKGYNSDAVGFENAIAPFLESYHKKALILGTGGASKAINYSLLKLGIETTYVSRKTNSDTMAYYQLDEQVLNDHLIVINASPVGTYPHANEYPDIPYQFLTNRHLLFDVVYNPAETLFLKKGKEMGAKGLNGETMLIEQAEAAWKIWNE